jgi:FG-GAP repeat
MRKMRTVELFFSVLVFSLSLCLHGWGQQVASLSSFPVRAQASVSAAVGRDISSYQAHVTGTGVEVVNVRHKLTSAFNSQGIEVRLGNAHWGMRLRGYGYGDEIKVVEVIAPQVSFNRVEYRRGSLTEWYVNGPMGLEQGFTINEPPVRANGLPLTVALTLWGDLTAKVDESRRGLTLSDRYKQSRLRYTGLTAYDANDKELSAWLELEGQQLLLKVADASARYPLVIDPWVQLAKLTASDGAPSDLFGGSVAISGNTVVVGAEQANQDQGAVYVFVKPASGWTNMTQTAKLAASDGGTRDALGYGVAISGNTVVAGAAYKNGFQGAAYVFVKPTSGWHDMTQTAKLTASDEAANDYFGLSVAVAGETVVVGAPEGANIGPGAAYVFVKPKAGWKDMTQTAKLTASDGGTGDLFGWSVATIGNTVVAGAQFGNSARGETYVFVKPVSGWADMTETAKLTASDGATVDAFGAGVGMYGNTVAVGGPYNDGGRGAVYVYVKPTSGWTNMTQTAKLVGSGRGLFGSSVAISGNTVVGGAIQASPFYASQGAAYIFMKPRTGWKTTAKYNARLIAKDGMSGDTLGYSVSMSGNTVIAGAPGAYNSGTGAAYVFLEKLEPARNHFLRK